jgi:hypothetical protein
VLASDFSFAQFRSVRLALSCRCMQPLHACLRIAFCQFRPGVRSMHKI